MKRLFMTFAAMLLVSVSAFAQSGNNNPLKGDVNGDGVVDVADIVAIIDIIKNNGEPQVTYYWYVGMTKPTASTNPESDLTTSTGTVQTTLGWIKLTSTPSAVHPEYDPGDFVDRTWWVAIPTEYNFQAYNTSGSATDNDAWPHNETVTIAGVKYTLFHNVNPMDSINVVLKP